MSTQNTPADAPLTFDVFQRLIRDRYYATDKARGTHGTFMHLTEEFGELATALYRNSRESRPPTPEERANLEEEIADVIAWVTTLANIHEISLARALSKYTTEGRVEGVKE